MKKRKLMIYSIFLILVLLFVVFLFLKNEKSYISTIVSYNENGSYVEYPQIEGLKDIRKQDAINKLLKDQIFVGAKTYDGENFVDFSNPECIYEFSSNIGFTNKRIASFSYSFFAYEKNDSGIFGFKGYTNRFFCITIDMETGEKIELSDFMEIDDMLINSNDGNEIEPDYNSPVDPTFHKFKDAFAIYSSDEERDAYHWRTVQDTIDRLKDSAEETTWYIDENKNIVFSFGTNSVSIPYNEISELIYSKYLTALEN